MPIYSPNRDVVKLRSDNSFVYLIVWVLVVDNSLYILCKTVLFKHVFVTMINIHIPHLDIMSHYTYVITRTCSRVRSPYYILHVYHRVRYRILYMDSII